MTVELKYLTWTCIAALVMWIPYILNAAKNFGFVKAMAYGDRDSSMDPWAKRMKKAHYNNVENLVVFGALILILNTQGITSKNTECAAAIYFYARVAYYFIYTFGIPWLRTLSFFAGWVATLMLACEILK